MDPTMQSQLMASALMRPQQNLYPTQQNQMQQPQQSMQGMGQQAGGLNMGALMTQPTQQQMLQAFSPADKFLQKPTPQQMQQVYGPATPGM